MRRFRDGLADPFVVSIVVLAAAATAGLISLAIGWGGAAARVNLADQMPYVVSGGFGGVALLGSALAVLAIQNRRMAEARRRAEFDRVVQAVNALLAVARKGSE